MRERLWVALDVETLKEADGFLERLAGASLPQTIGAKIGSQLFTAAGPAAVETAIRRGFAVFLDLKFHDIPNTVAGAVREATRMGVAMLNVHAAGGVAMMRAATDAATKAAKDFGVARPICIGVTVLTSLDRRGLDDIGVTANVEAQVLRLAERARDAGLDGCVASPQEIGLLRRALGPTWVIVTPGVRPGATAGSGGHVEGRHGSAGEPRALAGESEGALPPRLNHLGGHVEGRHGSAGEPRALGGLGGHVGAPQPVDDQKRVATPGEAIAAGADAIVVGRPITAAPDPHAATIAILEEIGRAARGATRA
jgi:orotidine-5'-phosphate decarboxylase